MAAERGQPRDGWGGGGRPGVGCRGWLGGEPREPPGVRGSEFVFEDVSVELGGREVLGNVSTSIADHGITVVLGPSGSGKSTLLRLCNRLVIPSSGRVCRQGVDIETIDPLALRRRVAMVFQRPTPFPGS
ncbi:MAG: ATP-binding cassette domain-containing protein, partial [Deltaproteobacteria bacterium]|nr:ATP-binding cassette domain-containing protein [Deltaproteobacteria bacterium]